jgi:mannan endo-1,4-beta-mannosidase
MTQVVTSQLQLLRVFGFNDVNTIPPSGTVWFQSLSATGSEINTGEFGLERLDALVESAQAHNVNLIIPLVNNFGVFGGIPAYVNAFGGNTSTWYTNEAAQAQYQAYIQAVVTRYLGATAVFAWELARQPQCLGCDP